MKVTTIIILILIISLQVQIYAIFEKTNRDRERIENLERKLNADTNTDSMDFD